MDGLNLGHDLSEIPDQFSNSGRVTNGAALAKDYVRRQSTRETRPERGFRYSSPDSGRSPIGVAAVQKA